MHLIHVASGREWRGGQRQTWLLARELAGTLDGDQVVITRRGSELARRIAANQIPLAAVPWRLGIDPRPLPTILTHARQPAAILHAHDPHSLALADWVSRRTGAIVIATRRATFPIRRPGIWQRARRIIALSQAIAQRLVADGIAPQRITVIPSGVDLAAARATTPIDVRQQFGIQHSAPIIATVAALTPEKGHRTLLAAAALLAGRLGESAPHWLLLGDGPLRSALAGEARRLGLAGTVHLAGHVPDPLGYLAAADIALLPSESEGLGSTLLDAMALGRPIVASAVGGIPEVLADGAGSLVPPGNADALARAVQDILTQPALAAAFGARAARQVERFGLDRMAAATRSVYRSLAHTPEGA